METKKDILKNVLNLVTYDFSYIVTLDIRGPCFPGFERDMTH